MTHADPPLRSEARQGPEEGPTQDTIAPEEPTPASPTLKPVATPVVTSEGVANAYALFLGKNAPPRFAERPGLTLPDLLTAILGSDEFRNEVLKRILLREELPSERFAGTPSYRLIDWAQRQLPIERATAVACGAAPTWLALLEYILADSRLGALAPEFAEAGVTDLLRDRVSRDPQYAVKHVVVGAVDAASSFEVRGWAVDLCDKSGPATLEFYADGVFVGAVRCDQPRPDVAEVIGGEGNVGFTFRIATAHRANFAKGAILEAVDVFNRKPISAGVSVHSEPAHHWDGITEARLEIARLREALQRIEAQLPELRRMASVPLEAYGEYWERFYRPAPDLLTEQRARSAAWSYRPLMSLVIPTYMGHARLLDKAIRSVLAQNYTEWELIISDDASPDLSEFNLLRRRYATESRIRWLNADNRGGIARNTNRGIAAAKGDYVVFLDHDDELAPDALYHSALALQERRYALIYSDEDRIEEDEYGRCLHHTPFFKPGFDPDLLLAMNYICHLVVVERETLRGMGGLRSGIDGAQDHDLLLRLAARLAPEKILHIPRILYHWRVTPGSVSQQVEGEESLRKMIVAVVDAHLRERGSDAVVEPHEDPIGRPRLFANRVRWRLPSAPPKVSIIIPTRDRVDLLEPCLESLLRAAPVYPGELEILVVDNDSNEEVTQTYFQRLAAHPQVRLLQHHGSFNWSAINNAAAREATGDILIFLNSDTLVLTPEWCNELVANALRPEIGAVGARLLYQDGTIQHAGVLVGVEGVAGHEGLGESPADGGYFGRSHLLRGTAAVTGACLATRRRLFLELGGGFDELDLKIAFNDVDFCMRVREAGYRIVYTPFAALYHFESKSRGRDLTPAQQARHRAEALTFRSRWGDRAVEDPYFNPHFERFARPFERLRPPPE